MNKIFKNVYTKWISISKVTGNKIFPKFDKIYNDIKTQITLEHQHGGGDTDIVTIHNYKYFHGGLDDKLVEKDVEYIKQYKNIDTLFTILIHENIIKINLTDGITITPSDDITNISINKTKLSSPTGTLSLPSIVRQPLIEAYGGSKRKTMNKKGHKSKLNSISFFKFILIVFSNLNNHRHINLVKSG